MTPHTPIARVVNLVPDASQRLWSVDLAEAHRRVRAVDPDGVLDLEGSFALLTQDGERVMLARSLDRPLRYFLAKAADGPVLIVAERIDEIAAELAVATGEVVHAERRLKGGRRPCAVWGRVVL